MCSRWESTSTKKAVGGACSSESGWFFLPLPAFSPQDFFFPNGFPSAHIYCSPTAERPARTTRGQQFPSNCGAAKILGSQAWAWWGAPSGPLVFRVPLPQVQIHLQGTRPGPAAEFPKRAENCRSGRQDRMSVVWSDSVSMILCWCFAQPAFGTALQTTFTLLPVGWVNTDVSLGSWARRRGNPAGLM